MGGEVRQIGQDVRSEAKSRGDCEIDGGMITWRISCHWKYLLRRISHRRAAFYRNPVHDAHIRIRKVNGIVLRGFHHEAILRIDKLWECQCRSDKIETMLVGTRAHQAIGTYSLYSKPAGIRFSCSV